jgi:hypothetical protein
MKPNLVKSSLILLSLSVGGCTTNTPVGGQAPAAGGAVVARDDMPEYCQSAAASKWGATPGNISTDTAVPRSFGFLVEGTADTGQQTYIFNCRFDSSGAFIGISEA